MKKYYFVLLIILCLFVMQYTFGQSTPTKKVAILETVDKENAIPYGDVHYCRVSDRNGDSPGSSYNGSGFRVVVLP